MSEWQDISTAPKDGTLIDLSVEGRRHTDCYWGKPDHCCGEAGRYCDSEWHSEDEWWVDSTFNEFLWRDEEPTHWMLPPAPPAQCKGRDHGE